MRRVSTSRSCSTKASDGAGVTLRSLPFLLGKNGALDSARMHLFVPKMSGDTFSVQFFPATVYSSNTAAMNTAVGVSGDLTDSLDSTTLLSGLSITLSGGNITTPIIETSLPALFDGNTFSSTCFSATQGISANQAWDATDSDEETNTSGNVPNNASTATNVAQLITF